MVLLCVCTQSGDLDTGVREGEGQGEVCVGYHTAVRINRFIGYVVNSEPGRMSTTRSIEQIGSASSLHLTAQIPVDGLSSDKGETDMTSKVMS